MNSSPTTAVQLKSSLFLWSILALGMVCVSFGSILVRLSQEAPSLVIAFCRMFWAAILLLPFYLVQGRLVAVQWKWQLIAGLALALHFAFWIASLRYTTVAVSVLLVNTSPLTVALLSYFTMGEQLTARGIVGLTCAFSGSLILLWNDLYFTGEWRGVTLSLLGALALGLYLLAGRICRQGLNLISYVYPTYVVAAVTLGIAVLVNDHSFLGYSSQTHWFLLLLGLIPQCLGHTSYNWALKYLSATLVSTLVLVEPLLATGLAWWILKESVGLAVLPGGILLGSGLFIVSRWGIQKQPVNTHRLTATEG